MLNWNTLLVISSLAYKYIYITSFAKGLSSKTGLFLRLSKFLKFNILCKLYFTLVILNMDSCITILGKNPSSNYHISGLDIVKLLGWMNVKELYQFFVATLCLNIIILGTPSWGCVTSIIIQHVLPPLPKPRTELPKRSLLYSGPFVWNSLPNHLKQATSILSFKRLYKKFTFSSTGLKLFSLSLSLYLLSPCVL